MQTLEQTAGRRTFTDSSQKNTTVEVSTHYNNRTKNDETKTDETKSVPNERKKDFRFIF